MFTLIIKRTPKGGEPLHTSQHETREEAWGRLGDYVVDNWEATGDHDLNNLGQDESIRVYFDNVPEEYEIKEVAGDAEDHGRWGMMPGPVCDLCSTPNPTWAYPSPDFLIVIGGIAQTSTGEWQACEVCHRLIQRDDKQALAVRCLDRMILDHPEMALDIPTVLEEIREVHAEFFANQTGGPVPINRLSGTVCEKSVDSGKSSG